MSEKSPTFFITHPYIKAHLWLWKIASLSILELEGLEKCLHEIDKKIQHPNFWKNLADDLEEYFSYEKAIANQSGIQQLEYSKYEHKYFFDDAPEEELSVSQKIRLTYFIEQVLIHKPSGLVWELVDSMRITISNIIVH